MPLRFFFNICMLRHYFLQLLGYYKDYLSKDSYNTFLRHESHYQSLNQTRRNRLKNDQRMAVKNVITALHFYFIPSHNSKYSG